MCRCLACNSNLSDHESTRKYASSGSFVDLCNRCFSTVADDIPDVDDGTTDDIPETEIDEEFNPYQWNQDDNG